MMSDLSKKRGAMLLSVVGSVAGGLALLIASQLFAGLSKANTDVADLKAQEAADVAGIKKDISYIKCAIKVQADITNKKKDISTICGE